MVTDFDTHMVCFLQSGCQSICSRSSLVSMILLFCLLCHFGQQDSVYFKAVFPQLIYLFHCCLGIMKLNNASFCFVSAIADALPWGSKSNLHFLIA